MEYITPTEEYPVYTAENDFIGYLENKQYKKFLISNKNEWIVGQTFALNYRDAINSLFDLIEQNVYILNEFPESKFNIYRVNGKWDNKVNNYKTEKIFSITAKKAKKLLNLQ